MPTIPHYNLDVDDLVGMDYLTFAKKRMIRDMKTDKTIDNANKYINETSYKYTGDISSTNNNFKNITNLLNSSYNLLSEIGSRIEKPVNVNNNKLAGNTNLIKEEPKISIDIIDKTNIINSNLVSMTDYFRLILNNPSIISKIPLTDVEKLINSYNKWYSKFIGNNPDIFDGVLSSQVLRLKVDPGTGLYERNTRVGDRLKRSAGKPSGLIDVETICNNFEEMLYNWYNFANLWSIFDTIYNAAPA